MWVWTIQSNRTVLKDHIDNVRIKPNTWHHSFSNPRKSTTSCRGFDIIAMMRAPMNVRGTTPGNSWWSYLWKWNINSWAVVENSWYSNDFFWKSSCFDLWKKMCYVYLFELCSMKKDIMYSLNIKAFFNFCVRTYKKVKKHNKSK